MALLLCLYTGWSLSYTHIVCCVKRIVVFCYCVMLWHVHIHTNIFINIKRIAWNVCGVMLSFCWISLNKIYHHSRVVYFYTSEKQNDKCIAYWEFEWGCKVRNTYCIRIFRRKEPARLRIHRFERMYSNCALTAACGKEATPAKAYQLIQEKLMNDITLKSNEPRLCNKCWAVVAVFNAVYI